MQEAVAENRALAFSTKSLRVGFVVAVLLAITVYSLMLTFRGPSMRLFSLAVISFIGFSLSAKGIRHIVRLQRQGAEYLDDSIQLMLHQSGGLFILGAMAAVNSIRP